MEMTGARVLTVLCCWLLALSFFESSRSSLMLFGAGNRCEIFHLRPTLRDYIRTFTDIRWRRPLAYGPTYPSQQAKMLQLLF